MVYIRLGRKNRVAWEEDVFTLQIAPFKKLSFVFSIRKPASYEVAHEELYRHGINIDPIDNMRNGPEIEKRPEAALSSTGLRCEVQQSNIQR